MGKTSIGWCDWSLNPIRARSGNAVGHYCEKLSLGCKHCYASRLQSRFRMPEFAEQRRGGVDVFLDPKVLDQAIRRKKPTRIFWCDMTDLFGAWVPDKWIDQIFAAMALSPQHTHLVLTKRAERMRAHLARLALSIEPIEQAASKMGYTFKFQDLSLLPWPIPNIHLAVSVEDQATADERIPILLDTPATLRWVSYEPALGPVDFVSAVDGTWNFLSGSDEDIDARPPTIGKLDWVVVGGESGHSARPFDLAWVRSTIAQCRDWAVPVFVKQLGANPIEKVHDAFGASVRQALAVVYGEERVAGATVHLYQKHRAGADPSEWPDDLRVRERPR